MNRDPMLVVMTGIDGTLIEGPVSTIGRATDAIDLLEREGIPLVFCSSNTRAEIESVQREVGIAHPFISENGAALFVPAGYFADLSAQGSRRGPYHVFEFGVSHAHVAMTLHLIACQLDIAIQAGSDSSVDEIARVCGVTSDRARLAKLREYDEPFRIVSRDPAVRDGFVRALRRARLRCTPGDYFDHVNGVHESGAALEMLRSIYERVYGTPVLTVGLGSRACDVAMLREVDLPVIVRDTTHDMSSGLLAEIPTARVTSGVGSAAWSQAIVDIVETVQTMRRVPREVRLA